MTHTDGKCNPKAWTITLPFSIIVLGLFFSLTAWNFYNFLGYKGITKKVDDKEFKQIIGRSPMWYAGPGEGRFFSGVFQDQLEKATADHFPLFAILAYKKIQRFLNVIILYPLPQRIKPLLPLGGDFSLIKNTQIIIEHPENILNKNTHHRLFRRAEYYNRIIKEFPDIRLLIMPVLTKFNWFIKANPKFNFCNPIKNNLIKNFRSMLDSKIICSVALEKYPPNEALRFYYKTDHHFSMRGAYNAYIQLIKLVNGDINNSVLPLKPEKWFTLPDIKFRGSLSRRIGGFKDIYDTIEDAKFHLPDYQIFINGIFSPEGYGGKKKYFNGLNSSELFDNHYGNYFGGDYGVVKFINSDNSVSENLLIIGDSYDNSIYPLISSHFKKSFFIDLRHYEQAMAIPFKIKNFIILNKINVVAFMGRYTWILGLKDLVED